MESDEYQEKVEKMLGMCVTKEELLQIERNIGTKFSKLKTVIKGCFVRIPVRGRTMLAFVESVVDRCQFDWAKFGRQLVIPPFGFFEFDQVHPEMPTLEEMERWCQMRGPNIVNLLSMQLIEGKVAMLNKYCPSKVEQKIANETTDSDQSEDELEEEDDFDLKDLQTLPNVVQGRELLVQVLLPCKDFLNFFSIGVKPNVIARATAGTLMAFRIAGEGNNKKVIVDEIASIKKPSEVHFKLLGNAINTSKLDPVGECEITDQVFDQWLQQLATMEESIVVKYTRKMQALTRLTHEEECAKQLSSLAKLPDIARIIVTGSQLQLLADNLGLDELNRLLTGCFVAIKMNRYILEVKEQPNLRGFFVVPIKLIAQNTETNDAPSARTSLFFNDRIPISHRDTGEQLNEVTLRDVWGMKLNGSHKLVLRSLAMMKELNIPWPSDEDVLRKSTELIAALSNTSGPPIPSVSAEDVEVLWRLQRSMDESALDDYDLLDESVTDVQAKYKQKIEALHKLLAQTHPTEKGKKEQIKRMILECMDNEHGNPLN